MCLALKVTGWVSIPFWILVSSAPPTIAEGLFPIISLFHITHSDLASLPGPCLTETVPRLFTPQHSLHHLSAATDPWTYSVSEPLTSSTPHSLTHLPFFRQPSCLIPLNRLLLSACPVYLTKTIRGGGSPGVTKSFYHCTSASFSRTTGSPEQWPYQCVFLAVWQSLGSHPGSSWAF